MKILLFGANGQLGWELRRSLAPLGEVIALGREGAEGLVGDLADPHGVAAAVGTVAPDVVVNAAAYTHVDRAETEPELARVINAHAPIAMARAARDIGAAMVHYSSDYVFDGSGDRPWREHDAPGPLSTYGTTKLEGDEGVVQGVARHLVIRSSWVYAARGHNFIKTILRLAAERDSLNVVDDQFGAPTGAELLADVTAHALRAMMVDASKAGTYHVAAAGATSWCEYARFVVGKMQQRGVKFRAGPAQIIPVSASCYETAATRPHNSRLDTARLRSVFDLTLPAWPIGVTRTLEEIL